MTDRPASLRALHRVAVHIAARARVEASGRFSLRVTPGGIGTPELGPDARRVRISGGSLIVESDRQGAASARQVTLHGATLRQLAEAAGVDLDRPLDVGHDTPALGDRDEPLVIEQASASAITGTYALIGAALDEAIRRLPVDAEPTLPRVWPEHFDVAIEAVAAPGQRVNLGGSPGDGFCAEPYLYVGPWGSRRPGDPTFWNAPFGSFAPVASLGGDDLASAAADYLVDGFCRLR